MCFGHCSLYVILFTITIVSADDEAPNQDYVDCLVAWKLDINVPQVFSEQIDGALLRRRLACRSFIDRD